MMWNGAFGALLFINDLEYLGSSNTCVVHPFRIAMKPNSEVTLSPGRICCAHLRGFFTNTTLPLLEGLLDWWACYLVKTQCSPAGTEACPVDGWRYDDVGDAVRSSGLQQTVSAERIACSHTSRSFDCEQSLLCSFLWLARPCWDR